LIKADYINNPENYLSAITKQNPTFDDRRIINKMKTEGFSNQCINVLIDLTLFKCKGELNPKYITLTANTVKNMGFSQNVDAIINYLQNNYDRKTKTNIIHKIDRPIYVHPVSDKFEDDSEDLNSFEEVE
jgi:replication initiation and membrane attachment protein DnaB